MVKHILKYLLYALLGIFVFLVVLSGVGLWYAWHAFARPFFTTAQISPRALIQQVRTGLHQQPLQTDGQKNILLLGLDEIEGRPTSSVLTDSMIITSLSLDTGNISLIPLPRDLWLRDDKTKINALYYYGKTKFPNHPEELPRQRIENITGLPLHHVVVLRLSQVAEVIDALGGIDIQIDRAFEDKLFPREGVDITKERDPAKLYETVRFEEGIEHMDGKRALEFMRSRHSVDLVEGTDNARSLRQEKVILATLTRVREIVSHADVVALGRLYKLYNQSFSQYLPLEDLVATGKMMSSHANHLQLSIKKVDISYLLMHPPVTTTAGQWTYEPIDPTWQAFRARLQEALFEE